MEKTDIADRLEAALTAWNKLPKSKQTRDALALRGINEGIRRGLHALDGETPKDLEPRGLAAGSVGEPIPDTYIPGVEKLIADLRAAE